MFSPDAIHLKEVRNRNICTVQSIHHWVLSKFLLCTANLSFWQTSETEIFWLKQKFSISSAYCNKWREISSYIPDFAFFPTVYIYIHIYKRFSNGIICIFLNPVYFQKLGIKYCSHILFNTRKNVHLIKLCKLIKKASLWYCWLLPLIISFHSSLKGFTKSVQD